MLPSSPSSPTAVREVGVRFLGLGSDPPHRAPTTSFSHLTLGLDVPTSPSPFGSLCPEPRWAHPAHQNPQDRRGPVPWPPGQDPREQEALGKVRDGNKRSAERRAGASGAGGVLLTPAPASPRRPRPLLPTSALPGSASRSTWGCLGWKSHFCPWPGACACASPGQASRGRVGAPALCPSVTACPSPVRMEPG